MPIKRRLIKARDFQIDAHALACWRAAGTAALDISPNGSGFIADDALAEALGRLAFVTYPDMDKLRAALVEEA